MWKRAITLLCACLAITAALAAPAWATRPVPGPPINYKPVPNYLMVMPLEYYSRNGSLVWTGTMRIYLDIKKGGSLPSAAASSEVLPASGWAQNGQSSANCRVVSDRSSRQMECLVRTGMASRDNSLQFGAEVGGLKASGSISGGRTVIQFSSTITVEYVPGRAAYRVCGNWRTTNVCQIVTPP